jgi:DNA ligase D-like protein (predicted 3'-phosphoesterase)
MANVKIKIEDENYTNYIVGSDEQVQLKMEDSQPNEESVMAMNSFMKQLAEASKLPLDIACFLIERAGLEPEVERWFRRANDDIVKYLAGRIQFCAMEILRENDLPWDHMDDVERTKALLKDLHFVKLEMEQAETLEQMDCLPVKIEPVETDMDTFVEASKVDLERKAALQQFGIPWNNPTKIASPLPHQKYLKRNIDNVPRFANKAKVQDDPFVPTFVQPGKLNYAAAQVDHLFRTGRVFMFHRHDAHRAGLHWDLRLEHRGGLKSWAVPKGPHLDPRRIRLAVETSEHNKDYGRYEGVIPRNRYGAGSVQVFEMGIFEVVDKVARDRANNDSDVEDLLGNEDWDAEQEEILDEMVDDLVSGRVQCRGNVPLDPVKLKAALKKKLLRQQRLFDEGWQAGHLSLYFYGLRLQGHYSLMRSTSKEGNALRMNLKSWINVTKYAENPDTYELFASEGSHWILVKKKDVFSQTKNVEVVDVGLGLKSVLTGRSVGQIIQQEPENKWWSWHRNLQEYKHKVADAHRIAKSARVTTPPTSPVRRLLPKRQHPSLNEKGRDGGEPMAKVEPKLPDDDVELIADHELPKARFVRGSHFYAWKRRFLLGQETAQPQRKKPKKQPPRIMNTSESEREREEHDRELRRRSRKRRKL